VVLESVARFRSPSPAWIRRTRFPSHLWRSSWIHRGVPRRSIVHWNLGAQSGWRIFRRESASLRR